MKYDDWQKSIMDANGDILACTGRQVGKTTVFSHKIAERMRHFSNQKIIVVSLTEDQAHLIIVMVLSYLEKNCLRDIQRGKNKPTKGRIWLRNGSSVISRPVGNTGDAVRGFTGDVLYIDEASGMPEMMWKAAMPTLMTTGGDIWMSSTPRGKFIGSTSSKNFFFKCWENFDNRWQVFNVTSRDVIKNRVFSLDWNAEKREKALKFLDAQQSILSEEEFGQEYEAKFLDDLRQWFDDDLIIKCMSEERPNTIRKNETYFLGVDVARMGEDESTFEILKLSNDTLIHVENQITTKTLLPQTTNHIKELHLLYDFSKIFIDSEGIGVGVFDWLMDDDNTKRITNGIYNSKQIISSDGKTKKLQKTLLYSNLKMLMETDRIRLLNDPSIFQSLKSVQYAYTNDNLGVRHLKIFGNYTHIAEGLVRSAWGIKTKHLKSWISSIKI